MPNIHRQAKQLLDKRDAGGSITWDEFQLINTALLPLGVRGCLLPEDMPIGDCLEELAKLTEESSLNIGSSLPNKKQEVI